MKHIWTLFFVFIALVCAASTTVAPDTASWLGFCFLSVTSVYAALASLIQGERHV